VDTNVDGLSGFPETERALAADLIERLLWADRPAARELAGELARAAWRAGRAPIANAATDLVAALGHPEAPYLGALKRLIWAIP
jgi:hypothetical protein